MPNFKQKFYDITHLVQREFDRNLDMYGDKIQCRKGCSKCCSQIFRITKLDAWIISEHVKSMPQNKRETLQQKAREYIARLTLSKGEWSKTEGVQNQNAASVPQTEVPLVKGDLGGFENQHAASGPRTETETGMNESHSPLGRDLERGQGLPCPALGSEGECTIYNARPVICRRFGMPIYDYKNPQNVYACDLNFKDGDEITDDQLIPNQTEIGKKWDALKEEFNSHVASATRADTETGGFENQNPASQDKHLPLSGGDTEGVTAEGTTIAEAIANA
jgi:Fe-S-cluster containining protein